MKPTFPITDTIAELKRLQNNNRKLKSERETINEIAKKQRVEIRRLKRLLDDAIKLIPHDVRADKFFESADNAIQAKEL